jgi:hypothetical protein
MAELELLAGQRQSGESDAALIACNDYLRMGPGRSFSALAQKYNDLKKSQTPTQSLTTLFTWSSRFEWQQRATAFDAAWEAIKNEERRRVMEFGIALDFERVRKLMRLAEFLESQLYEQGEGGEFHNVWLPDVKSVGSGEFAERVDIERFNGDIISQYRAVLDDIAKEVGGRIKKQEVSGKDGGALIVQVVRDDNAEK